ncbi:MAG: DUF4286 family protein [Pseudomonadota bacterium]
MNDRVVYEVSLRVPADRSIELGAWLPGHIEEMLALPGFIEANTLEPVDEGDDRIHIVQYVLSNQAALDTYFAEHAERMRAPGIAQFGDDLSAKRAVRQVVEHTSAAATCLNCGVQLTGQYCWNCGQRGNTRLISVWELIRDAVGDMFELDSRLWRTVRPLLFRPGHLTAEYLRGRRAHYMPPFRMYLILSFIFFLITQWSSDSSFGQGFLEGFESGSSGELDALIEEGPLVEIEIPRETVVGFENGQLVEKPPEPQVIELGAPEVDDAEPAAEDGEDANADGRVTITVESSDEELRNRIEDAAERERQAYQNCYTGMKNVEFQLPYVDEEWGISQVRKVCAAANRDGGQDLLGKLVELLPVIALAMLPLLALFLKIISPFKRRYYVEHLLLLVHYHSFVFLIITLTAGIMWVIDRFRGPDMLYQVVATVVSIWTVLYLLLAMRKVYAQNWFLMVFKYFLLVLGYLVAFVIVLLGGVLYIGLTY